MSFTNESMNISVCQYENCGKLQIVDTSTDYDLALTINGEAVISAVIGVNGEEFDVFSIFSAATSQDDLVYTSDDVLEDASATDGFKTISYVLTTANATYTMYEKRMLFYCEIECCVYKMIKDIPSYYCSDKCNKIYIDNALTAWGLLLSLRFSMMCGDLSRAEQTYNMLKTICDTNNCNCN